MEDTLKYISFGSGSSGNCCMLWNNTEALIIDAGVGTRMLKKYFREYGVSLPPFTSILITHDHADHVKCVGSLSHEHSLSVYATQAVHEGIDKNYCVNRKVPNALRRYVDYEQTVEIGSFRVTPFQVPHDSTDNVGYQVEWQDITFVLITDAGCVTEGMANHIRQANYLVLEADYDVEKLEKGPYPYILKQRIKSDTGHLSNVDSANALIQYATPRLKHVWLCHLSQNNNDPDLAQKTVEQYLTEHGMVGRFQVDVLRRLGVTGVFTIHNS